MSETNNNFPGDIDSITQDREQTMEEKSNIQEAGEATESKNSIDWHKLAHKLREHNRKLLKKVFQLEQDILESNQALEEQKKLSRSNDLFANKQAEQINKYQEEIAQLLQKVESYQQESHSQQNTINSLNQQLESFRQNATELAQECAELQKANNSKTYELLSKKQELQELNTRLQRQKQPLSPTKPQERAKVGSEPIKAWSANLSDRKMPSPAPLVGENYLMDKEDWPAPAIAKRITDEQATNNFERVNSISAVQLPRFSRQVEGE